MFDISKEKEQFIEAFTINTKLYSSISEKNKRAILLENTNSIKELSKEDRLFVAKMIYDIIINGKGPLTKVLRNFIFEKLRLKFKYMAERIIRYQINKAHCQLYKLELLQNGIIKAQWCYLGGTCNIEKHKVYGENKTVFNLGTGLFDENLKKYIFPTDLENCDCSFLPIVEI